MHFHESYFHFGIDVAWHCMSKETSLLAPGSLKQMALAWVEDQTEMETEAFNLLDLFMLSVLNCPYKEQVRHSLPGAQICPGRKRK